MSGVDDQNAVCLGDLGAVHGAACWRKKTRGLKKKSGLRPKKQLHPNDGPVAKIQLGINRRRLQHQNAKEYILEFKFSEIIYLNEQA